MTLATVQNPFETFLGLNGAALNGGHVYIGVVGQDPATNPVAVFWDAAGTIPAFQPIDVMGGYLRRAGSPAQAYVADDYSIRVTDRFGIQVYYAASGLKATSAAASIWIASGTGAINRDVQAKLRERVGPTEYGADGTADITALYLANNANSQIFVAGGSYDVNTPFTLGAGKTLVMDPAALFTGASKFSTDIAAGGSAEGHTGGAEGLTRFFTKRLTGAITAGAGIFSSYTSAFMFDILSDDRDVGSDFSVGLRIRHQFGGAATKGAREAVASAVYLTAPTNAANLNRNYVAIQGKAFAQTGDGGTDTGAGAKGAIFGLGGAAYAEAGATNLLDIIGAELNTFVHATATSRHIRGLTIAMGNGARGVDVDAFVALSGLAANNGYPTHIGCKQGIVFTNYNGADPTYSATTLFCGLFGGGGLRTIYRGIDLTAFTATDAAFISTGFKVNALGNVEISGATAGLELGSKTGVGSALVDFNTSGNGNDYDARIIGSGGTGVQGGGTLQVLATTFKMPTDVWFGIYTAGGDTASNGYITIKDTAGNTRKVMTTA